MFILFFSTSAYTGFGLHTAPIMPVSTTKAFVDLKRILPKNSAIFTPFWAFGYPLMEIGHEVHVATIKTWLDHFENLLPIGRAGMFKYNNQDHAMATGLLAARSALGIEHFDPWRVNIDAAYHESAPAA